MSDRLVSLSYGFCPVIYNPFAESFRAPKQTEAHPAFPCTSLPPKTPGPFPPEGSSPRILPGTFESPTFCNLQGPSEDSDSRPLPRPFESLTSCNLPRPSENPALRKVLRAGILSHARCPNGRKPVKLKTRPSSPERLRKQPEPTGAFYPFQNLFSAGSPYVSGVLHRAEPERAIYPRKERYVPAY